MSRCSADTRAVVVLGVCQPVTLGCSELWHER